MPSITELREALQARPVDGAVNLAGYSTTDTPFIDSKSDAKDYVDGEMQDDLFDRHELLYAEEERSILLVLQGLDCSGKNGTIKHVVIAMNPAGVRTASFKEPTKEELDHHFLWRYRNELPDRTSKTSWCHKRLALWTTTRSRSACKKSMPLKKSL